MKPLSRELGIYDAARALYAESGGNHVKVVDEIEKALKEWQVDCCQHETGDECCRTLAAGVLRDAVGAH